MALKIAEVSVLEERRRTEPLFLLDDVSSEFDEKRLDALLGYLGSRNLQMFVTTTRPAQWGPGNP